MFQYLLVVFCFFFNYLFIYFWLCWVFIAAQVFSSCGQWELLSSFNAQTSHFSSFFLWFPGSRAQAQLLQCGGLVALLACGIFPDQGSNPRACTGRQIHNHWTTRKVLSVSQLTVYVNVNGICVLQLYKNCINLNYAELVHSAFQVCYILLPCIFILLIFEALILKRQLKVFYSGAISNLVRYFPSLL